MDAAAERRTAAAVGREHRPRRRRSRRHRRRLQRRVHRTAHQELVGARSPYDVVEEAIAVADRHGGQEDAVVDGRAEPAVAGRRPALRLFIFVEDQAVCADTDTGLVTHPIESR